MTIQPNGTDAKEIALEFIKLTSDGRATPAIIGKTINQAKNILNAGYTKEEIIKVLHHVVDKGIQLYSIGYISSCINDTLREIVEQEKKEEVKRVIAEQKKTQQAELGKAVISDGESGKRNAEKAKRFGLQSRFREKFDFDMFEE